MKDGGKKVGSTGRSGRKRDPAVEQKILRAALEVYCEQGWAGFNFDVIARRAGVGKAPVYLRWTTREDLLLEVTTSFPAFEPKGLDTRDELIALGHYIFGRYLEPPLKLATWLRVRMDAATNPALFRPVEDAIRLKYTPAFDKILANAAKNRALGDGPGTRLLIDMFAGGIINHLLYTTYKAQAQHDDDAETMVRRFADMSIAGAMHANEAARRQDTLPTQSRATEQDGTDSWRSRYWSPFVVSPISEGLETPSDPAPD